MNNKKQLILSIGLTLVLVLMIVGISYAAFKFVGLGNKPNTITTGAITMEYEESTNTISMTGALPTTDATGKVRLTAGEYFDFTIKSSIKGNTNINWEIAAEDITPSSAKKMDGKNIKFYLTKLNGDKEEEVMAPKVYSATTSANTKTGRPSGVMSLATGTMSTSETTNYRLRMYVDEDYNPQGDGGDLSFSIKVNVYGKVKEEPTGSKLKAYTTSDSNSELPKTDFHTSDYMYKITSIVTKNNNTVPETAIESWDVSETGDGSVMAYAEDDGKGEGTYKVTIGGKGGIVAPENMNYYFYNFSDAVSIDLSAFNLSNVTDMEGIFWDCRSLTSLDVSNFDTSSVTNMSRMFQGCYRLTNLNVSNFDTLNVTDMKGVFWDCRSLTSLDVSNFDTSKVTKMDYMFDECDNLTNLDVSGFDTSKVTDMSGMFDRCSRLTSLDVSGFDTSNVTDMGSMFWYCRSLTSLDVSNFDTSKVTNMGWMFSNCSSLTSLDLSNFDTSNVARTGMFSMFSNCSSLTSLDLSNFDTSNVRNIGEMFSNCSSLTSLNLSNFNTTNVTDMYNMFSNCSSLTSLNLKSFDTWKTTNMDEMFSGATKLTNIMVSNYWRIQTSTSTTDMFKNCGTDHVTVA